MYVKRATKEDMLPLQIMMNCYGREILYPEIFNNHDIALQARDDEGRIIGFLWCGVMAKGTFGYLDKFVVTPEYSRKGVGKALASAMKVELVKRKVKRVFAVIRQDEYHDKSAFNALRFALGAHKFNYTLIDADVAHAVKELEMAGM